VARELVILSDPGATQKWPIQARFAAESLKWADFNPGGRLAD
jgi:hypothetical protein